MLWVEFDENTDYETDRFVRIGYGNLANMMEQVDALLVKHGLEINIVDSDDLLERDGRTISIETRQGFVEATDEPEVFENVYQTCLNMLDACNLSGIIFDLPKIANSVWKELRAEGKGSTDDFRKHPVMRIISEKFDDLTRGMDFSDAYKACIKHV
jgi:hypothetical protein